MLFRFVITPLFLFSGVFFPVTQLPSPFREIAWFTPLFHGVALVRGLTLNTLESSDGMLHVGYLVALLTAGYFFALRSFTRKLRA